MNQIEVFIFGLVTFPESDRGFYLKSMSQKFIKFFHIRLNLTFVDEIGDIVF